MFVKCLTFIQVLAGHTSFVGDEQDITGEAFSHLQDHTIIATEAAPGNGQFVSQ